MRKILKGICFLWVALILSLILSGTVLPWIISTDKIPVVGIVLIVSMIGLITVCGLVIFNYKKYKKLMKKIK